MISSRRRGPAAGPGRLLLLRALLLGLTCSPPRIDAFPFATAGRRSAARPLLAGPGRPPRARAAFSPKPTPPAAVGFGAKRQQRRAVDGSSSSRTAPIFAADLGREPPPPPPPSQRQRIRTYYDILGAPPAATRAELKRRYVDLARRTHPDALIGRNKEGSGAAAAAAATDDADADLPDFTEVAEAYEVLSDPFERKRYDRGLRADEFVERTASAAVRVGGAVGLVGRIASPLFRKAAAAVSEDLKPKTEEVLGAAWRGAVEAAERAKADQERAQREGAERERVERERVRAAAREEDERVRAAMERAEKARVQKEEAEKGAAAREEDERARAAMERAEKARVQKEEEEEEEERRRVRKEEVELKSKQEQEARARQQPSKKDLTPNANESNDDLVRNLGVQSTLIESGDLKESLDSVKGDLEAVMRMSEKGGGVAVSPPGAAAAVSPLFKSTNSSSGGGGGDGDSGGGGGGGKRRRQKRGRKGKAKSRAGKARRQ